MAAAAKGGGSPQDAKHLLDSIGKDVHDKVKGEAENYIDDLKAYVSFASIFGEEMRDTDKPCKLESKYNELIEANSKRNPCKKDGTGKEDVNRFSKERVDEYDNKKIKCSNGSNGKDEGACASFRRLHLCNKNMEKIPTSSTKHDLLLDVCMAAKFEGESLNTYRAQYDEQYPGSGFTLCTMLARSFADIGDIIRGKDLFRGYNQKDRKEKE
ncbi:hypothetical protein PFAG_05948, partial [Plasmodium falciparum Santa Lucia]